VTPAPKRTLEAAISKAISRITGPDSGIDDPPILRASPVGRLRRRKNAGIYKSFRAKRGY
jgi:hypothetical protein